MRTRFAKRVLAVTSMGVALACAVGAFVRLQDHVILSVRIAGEFNHVSEQQLQEVVKGFLPAGFFVIDVDAVRNAALGLPWVKEALVRRVWPDSLHVAVIERVAFARWGERVLIEADGTPFVPHAGAREAPALALSGPPGSEAEVIGRYRELAPLLAGVRGGLIGLSLDARGLWRARLARGPELVLGKRPSGEAIGSVARALSEQLADRANAIERIDLRYTNGFAVRWKVDRSPELAG